MNLRYLIRAAVKLVSTGEVCFYGIQTAFFYYDLVEARPFMGRVSRMKENFLIFDLDDL